MSDPKPLRDVLELPPWIARFADLDPVSQRAWDERIRRIELGTATEADREVQERARRALADDEPLPREARRMPGPELAPDERTWKSDALDAPERAVAWGIPPLIAERIAAGGVRVSRSTRACALVGRDYLILVLIGAVGCGKSFAAASWLWSGSHEAPRAIRRRVGARRFLEAPALADVEFADRAALGESLALVLDDAGTEKPFLHDDVAKLLVARYRNGLPTVVTTNLSEADLVAIYGVRFADRMREVGRFVVVSNSAADSLR